jgi:hypothetical protein
MSSDNYGATCCVEYPSELLNHLVREYQFMQSLVDNQISRGQWYLAAVPLLAGVDAAANEGLVNRAQVYVVYWIICGLFYVSLAIAVYAIVCAMKPLPHPGMGSSTELVNWCERYIISIEKNSRDPIDTANKMLARVLCKKLSAANDELRAIVKHRATYCNRAFYSLLISSVLFVIQLSLAKV